MLVSVGKGRILDTDDMVYENVPSHLIEEY